MLSVTPPGRQEPTTGFAPVWSALRERCLSQSSHVGTSRGGRSRTRVIGFGSRSLTVEPHPLWANSVRVSGGSRTRRYGVHGAACHAGTLPTPSVSGRSGSRTRKAVSGSTAFQAVPVADRVALPFQSSRVDSNHRSSPCRGAVLAAERRDESAPRPGVEPGTPRSRRGMMSVSPSGRQRKVRDSNPRGVFQPSRLATEFLNRPDTFRISGPTGARTRIAGMPCRNLPVGPWARDSVDRRGVEPRLPTCEVGVFPIGRAAHSPSVIPHGLEPWFPACEAGVVATGPRDQKAVPTGVDPVLQLRQGGVQCRYTKAPE